MNRRDLLRFALRAPLLAPMVSVTLSAPAMAANEVAQARIPARKAKPPKLLLIDPGHGGRDPGAIGSRGTYEKDIVLDIAKEVGRLVGRNRGIDIAFTRDSDIFIELPERRQMGQAMHADLFVSIHADSAPNRKARGLSAYTLSETASDAFAAAIAQQENLAGGLGVDMSDLDENVAAILVDLAARHTRTAALHAKQSIVSGAGKDLHLLENPMRAANFSVLKAPDVPSLLIETGFLSNAQDEQLLRDPAARKRIASILARELTAVLTTAPFA